MSEVRADGIEPGVDDVLEPVEAVAAVVTVEIVEAVLRDRVEAFAVGNGWVGADGCRAHDYRGLRSRGGTGGCSGLQTP